MSSSVRSTGRGRRRFSRGRRSAKEGKDADTTQEVLDMATSAQPAVHSGLGERLLALLWTSVGYRELEPQGNGAEQKRPDGQLPSLYVDIVVAAVQVQGVAAFRAPTPTWYPTDGPRPSAIGPEMCGERVVSHGPLGAHHG